MTNDEICAAIKDVFDDTRTVMEPAGALAVAGLKTWVEREGARNQSLVALLSGANINFDRLRFVAERAEVGEARETLHRDDDSRAAGLVPEILFRASAGRTVTEFNYRLSGRQQAHIFVGFATQSRQDGSALAAQLAAAGYETVDLTDNEMAKLHVRHMVGGHAPEVRNERLCRFEFPERPGALAQFLEKLGGRWNISLFHYRNHGADFGRVLAGFEVAEERPAGVPRTSSTSSAIRTRPSTTIPRTGSFLDSAREQFMQAALEQARLGAAAGEVPIGAVLVVNDTHHRARVQSADWLCRSDRACRSAGAQRRRRARWVTIA